MPEFMGGLFGLVIVGLFFYGLFAGVRAAVRAFRKERDGGAGAARTSRDRVYTLAEKALDFAAKAAQPSELEQDATFAKGVALLKQEDFTLDDLVAFATGNNLLVACMAMCALRERDPNATHRAPLVSVLDAYAIQSLHFALRYIEGTPAAEPVLGKVLAELADELYDAQRRAEVGRFVVARLSDGEEPSFEGHLSGLSEWESGELRRFLSEIDSEHTDKILAAFDASSPRTESRDMPSALRGVGKMWEPRTKVDELIVRHEAMDRAVGDIREAILARPPRSSILVGPAGVGKSTTATQLAGQLSAQGWRVFVAGANDLIAGQMYIGQFEGRLKEVIEALAGDARTLWVIPDFPALAHTGRHHYNPSSALDVILPAIESGMVRVLGLADTAAYEKMLQTYPRVATALRAQRLKPLDAEAVKVLGHDWLRAARMGEDRAMVDEAWSLAAHFLSDQAPPGNLMKLLELTRERLVRGKRRQPMMIEDVLVTLAELTGLPLSILDPRQSLDLNDLRARFESRVIGQDEAVETLLQRVAMIKAGVTDHGRPAGVFLFAGPTGTGKTEIAKTLTEWLFGTVDRMIRLDMSEFQTSDSLERLTGAGGHESGALTDRIREQPFSVVLLDEFEKAHPNVWDLFLQVFDDARLTDRLGRTADFRHAIVILTSNLGAAVPTGAPLGFAAETQAFDPSSVLAAVGKAFRPEFVNRLDRVVVFRPRSREVMRQILQNELDAAIQRRGLRARAWAVEWDESAIEFLLEKGFTPDLGARPLRRAIEDHFLGPLAMAIVNHQVPAGDQFLFVARKGAKLDIEFVDPDAGMPGETGTTVTAAGADLSPRSIMLQPSGDRAEFDFLRSRHVALQEIVKSEEWAKEKNAALAMMALTEFWQSPERFEILGLAEYLDRIEAGVKRTGSLLGRLASGGHRNAFPGQMIESVAQNLYLLETAAADVQENRPRDAYLLVEPVGTVDAASAQFADRIGGMYRAWAERRKMPHRMLIGPTSSARNGHRLLLAVSGFGAHTILAPENGMHVRDAPKEEGRADKADGRQTVRVRVAPQPPAPPDGDDAAAREQAIAIFSELEADRRKVVRRYRESPSPLVRDAVRGWRTGRLDRVLAGDFDLFETD